MAAAVVWPINPVVAKAMILLARDAGIRAKLSAGAVTRARQTTWDAAADMLYTSFTAIEDSADRVPAAQ
jgi:hypothetical protein